MCEKKVLAIRKLFLGTLINHLQTSPKGGPDDDSDKGKGITRQEGIKNSVDRIKLGNTLLMELMRTWHKETFDKADSLVPYPSTTDPQRE